MGDFEIPNFFSDKDKILNFDYSKIKKYIGSSIDHSKTIDNLSPGEKDTLLIGYFKSILLGYNHVYISKILNDLNNPSANICLPLLNQWQAEQSADGFSIDNLIIINHPDDAERISKLHVKKAPIFKSLLNDSIISTTDNDDWKTQRGEMNMSFLPNTTLKNIFHISRDVAKDISKVIVKMSDNYNKSVDMSDFFLNETQAQLQKALFGFSDDFEKATNKRIRNVFAGINTEYLDEFVSEALKQTKISSGPASQLFNGENRLKDIGNMILFSFAGHDTTGHTLTWLLYELCKHPEYKQRLIKEIDDYWLKYKEPVYETFNELSFMTRCITETLRMWPALANGTYRELERDDSITGIDGEKVFLKKGTYVQIMNFTRHRNPELWEDPHIFNPDREFKDSEIWNHKGFGYYNVQSDRFSPFAYGPRNCLGKNFSHMEMRLILLNIFKDHDFKLSDKQVATIDDPKYMGINTFTMGPADIKGGLLGMYINIYPRKSKI
jgi:cytochrome P450